MAKTKEEVLAHYGLDEQIVEYKGVTDEAKGILKQYGVLGMKWGVRRDRSTLDRIAGRKAGKPRPSKKQQDKNRAASRSANRSARQERRDTQKNRRNLSTSDVRERIDRLKLERELTKLTNEDLRPITTKVTNMLSNAGWEVASNTTKATMTVLTRSALEKGFLGTDEISKYLRPKK